MKRLFNLLLVFLLTGTSSIFAQITLKGTVKDFDSGKPLPGVKVQIVGSIIESTTDANGYFEINNLEQGNMVIDFVLEDYQTTEQEVNLTEDTTLPDIMLKRSQDSEGALTFSEITISSDDLESAGGEQSITGLLQSSQDAFTSAASYTFSPARFQIRGYDSDYSLLYLNGVPVNDPESGWASWSSWGGLNDVTRNKESRNGLTPTDWSFGGLGGATQIDARASQQRAGTKISYASTNRTYTNRVMFTHSTGMMENGVALTISGSRRWAEEGYVKGTNYDAWAYFVGIEKKFNDKHSVAFTTFNAPTKRGMQGVSTDEAKNLVGDNYYNPNWGYQNGEKRNARVRFQQEPTFILNHNWNVSPNLKVTNTVGFSFGTYQTTSLNWYDAQDPRPDYYRKLPSYWIDSDPDVMNFIADIFSNNTDYNQINWDYMYQVNYNSLDTATNTLRSKYIVENRITDSRQLTYSTVGNWNPIPELKVNGGINASIYKGRNYKKIDDLLGGDYWLDIDQFVERDYYNNPNLAQNDLDNPNRKVKKGDVFGYDYDANVDNGNVWATGNYSLDNFDYYFGGNYTYTEFWRTGNMRNGRFPDGNDSKGNSAKQKFNDYGVKGGATWKISGRHYLDANLSYMTRAPFFRNSYISPRTSNFVIPGLSSEKIASADINYNLRTPYIKARFSAYYTKFMDQTELQSFYDDYYRTFINYTMRNIDKVHKGIEFGAEIKISPTLTANAAVAAGTYQYKSRPLATVTQDNLGTILQSDQVVYIKNFYVANTPQTAATLGLRYASPKYWFFGVTASYFDDIYVEFAPGKRTAEALVGLEEGDPYREKLTDQIKLPSACLLDANIGKSWKIKDYYINLNFSVSNVLDKTDFKTGGYEQARYSIADQTSDKFPPKYFYAYGRTYYLTLGFRF
ncbi:MAG TPA: TonB-dependent receptor [Tenuifilaceae bacterium]|nr:TonB-dependent receptor [Tenuifilaceae bacterium]